MCLTNAQMNNICNNTCPQQSFPAFGMDLKIFTLVVNFEELTIVMNEPQLN